MTAPSWTASGQYYETCSCDFVCPCILQQMVVEPTHGTCTFAMAFQIERGSFGKVSLDGLGFIVLGLTPEAMVKGNWSVGVMVGDRGEPGRYVRAASDGDQSRGYRASSPGQYRPSGVGSRCPCPRIEEPRRRARLELERHQRKEQRPVRAVQLA